MNKLGFASFRRAIVVGLMAAILAGAHVAPVDAATSGVAAGRSWALWVRDGREGGTWYHVGFEWGLVLTGSVEFGGASWAGTIPLRFRRAFRPFDGYPELVGRPFHVVGVGGTLDGQCVPRYVAAIVLDCTASINGGPTQQRVMRIFLPVDSGPIGSDETRTYDPVTRWYKGSPHLVAGRFALV